MSKDVRDLIVEAREAAVRSALWDIPHLLFRLADALEAVTSERDAALAGIERVRAVHQKDARRSGWEVCTHCEIGMLQDPVDWPCPTVAALDGAPEPEEEEP